MMKFNIGDRVAALDEDITGVVKAVKNAAVYIQQHPELASLPADCGA